MRVKPWQIIVDIAGFLFLVNIILLDIWALKFTTSEQTNATFQPPQNATLITPVGTSSSSAQITLTPTPVVIYQTQTVTSGVKEFFIPLGQGQSSASDWTDVPGLVANINSTSYPNMKTVVFEVSMHIPTGNQTAYVRLFNVTDGHPVWFSDLSLTGGAQQFLVSQPITLDSGNKQYQVQMKTQLQFQAILDQARVHITLQ